MLTIYDVAKKTGYSISTVSKAMNGYNDVNESTRNKILKACHDLGYKPNANARALSGKSGNAIGLILAVEPDNYEMKSNVFSFTLEFINRLAYEGYDVLTLAHRTIQRSILVRKIDGVVILCGENQKVDYEGQIRSEIPAIKVELNSFDCEKTSKKYGYDCATEIISMI